ncbi:MAG: nucleotidyl transferase AbiEii/AbiGii toxin family protein [Mariprofundaceae bacterium]|nr:nucleotidyl transferase AbiEii/AbiGii toxin family protein [Mariprofundaceae bacterium]
MEQFIRPHHRRIARVLSSLDSSLLRKHHCLFAGGTVIAMRFGEYRESVDIDFLVSDVASYRNLRQLLKSPGGIANLFSNGSAAWIRSREIRADQYGIRTELIVDDQPIKFEIVLEGRMTLEPPGAKDAVCGIATLTPLDMATSKLLANSDRWADAGVFSRDVIDLAMMKPSPALLREAVAKAEPAYGAAVCHDLESAIQRLQDRPEWLDRCMGVMTITQPRAVVWNNLRALRRACS